jgi:hypothetical protein
MQLTFGSGTIAAVIATDIADVGHVRANMDSGLLLMVDQALTIEGSFEGILGLGLPINESSILDVDTEEASTASQDEQQIEQQIEEALSKKQGGGAGGDEAAAAAIEQGIAGQAAQGVQGRMMEQPLIDGSLRRALQARRAKPHKAAKGRGESPLGNPARKRTRHHAKQITPDTNHTPATQKMPQGFLDYANISHFSMCFNEGRDGVLRLGHIDVPQPLGSIGTLHWGLDFRGVSVGKSSAPVLICSPEEKLAAGQETACGIIPDSGTTQIMGPADQVEALLVGICEGWDRCKQNHTALMKGGKAAHAAMVDNYGYDPYNIDSNQSMAAVVKLLLADCGQWLEEGSGLDELPDLHFHVAGSAKPWLSESPAQTSLVMPGWAYVMESSMPAELLANTSKKNASHGKATKVCEPMFGTMEYPTTANGPVWIMGTPLFYEYQVGYNTKSEPPSMSFVSVKESPCGSCDAKTSFISEKVGSRAYNPRKINGSPRVPRLDTRLPL